MASPPNFTKNKAGFNKVMFRSERAIRRGFMMIGYAVNTGAHKVPEKTVLQFQKDFNKCSDRFGQWGKVAESGRLDIPTLNALEHAIRWSKKRENRDGTPSARSWQSLCHVAPGDSCGGKVIASRIDEPEAYETRYIEVTPQGSAKLRDTETDMSLRAEVVRFERDGNVVFAIVKIPPQADLPGGREEPFRCPCVLGR